jgi:hypothetical protein
MSLRPAAIGLSVHTGWASCVIAGGTLRKPQIEHREIVEVLDDALRFVFHMAEKRPLAAAEKGVAAAQAKADVAAKAALAGLVERMKRMGMKPAGCAIVAKDGPMPGSVAEIVAAHPRIHTAEGCFYRDVFRDACRAARVPAAIVSPKDIDARAAKALRVPADAIAPLLVAAGKIAGRPWSKDERLAALGAWIVLAGG